MITDGDMSEIYENYAMERAMFFWREHGKEHSECMEVVAYFFVRWKAIRKLVRDYHEASDTYTETLEKLVSVLKENLHLAEEELKEKDARYEDMVKQGWQLEKQLKDELNEKDIRITAVRNEGWMVVNNLNEQLAAAKQQLQQLEVMQHHQARKLAEMEAVFNNGTVVINYGNINQTLNQ